jgi:malonyl-CoA O-methyltransferase
MSYTSRAIDRTALQRAAHRMAGAPAPWLHGEVARRMAERLAIVKLQPSTVIDWQGATSASAAVLRSAYPKAALIEVGTSARIPEPTRWWPGRRARTTEPLDPARLDPAQAQLVWANMVLHGESDPGALFVQWRRALAVDGFTMFSTLGPDTLRSLRELYRDAGWGPPHAPFVDMHDLGDMLVGAGFAAPVMDQEVLRLHWASAPALLAELRTLGINADPARHAGLRTPRWRARLETALAARAGSDGRIALEFEVVYGHAFNPPPRVRVEGEARIDADELVRMARGGRRRDSLG